MSFYKLTKISISCSLIFFSNLNNMLNPQSKPEKPPKTIQYSRDTLIHLSNSPSSQKPPQNLIRIPPKYIKTKE